jgi:hypothetical protein
VFRRTDLDPTAVRELEELDRALAGDPAAEPELALLIADVRAAAGVPDDAFVARLDREVAARFPRPERAPRRRPALTWRLAPAGALLAGLVALVVVLGSGTHSADLGQTPVTEEAVPGPAADAGTGASGESFDTDDRAVAPQAAAPSLSAPVPPVTPSAPGGRRSVERDAELTLTPPVDEVQEVADGVVRTAQAAGGYVGTSEVDIGEERAEARFTLRIPSARLDDALARLSKLASVGGLRQASTDITGAVESAEGRLSDARAERRALLRALGRATTEREIRSLRARLADSRRRIAADEAALERQRRRASLATVAVTVTGDAAQADGDDGGAWTPGDAVGDAWRVLQIAGGVLVVGLAVLLPFGLLALLGRLLLRRRREAVLEG